jgi:hypothetical protein
MLTNPVAMPGVVGQYTVFGISTANFLQIECSGNQTGVLSIR